MSNDTVEIIEVTDTARIVVVYDSDGPNPRQDWDMMTGFVKIEGKGDSSLIDVEPVHNDPTSGIAAAFEHFGEAGYVYVGQGKGYNGGPYQHRSWIDAERLTVRWARAFYGLHLEYDSEHGGFWFVDPEQMEANFPAVGDGTVQRFRQQEGAPINTYEPYVQDFFEASAEVIKGERETYRQWAEGEIYGVVFERLETFAKSRVTRLDFGFEADLTVEPEVFDEWTHAASLWDCYLDDDYTAEMVALDELDVKLTDEERAALEKVVAEQRARRQRVTA